MTREEFNNYYHLHSVDKCCWHCHFADGYVEWLKCKHPFRDINEAEYVEATQVCDAFQAKTDEDWFNE